MSKMLKRKITIVLCILTAVFMMAFATSVLSIKAYADETLNLADVEFVMEDGAQVRHKTKAGDNGIRFMSKLSEDDYKALNDNYDNLSFGYFIMPNYYISQFGDLNYKNCFSEEKVYVWGEEVAGNNQHVILQGETKPVLNGSVYEVRGSIANVKSQNLATKFTSAMYIKCEKDNTVDYVFSTVHVDDRSMIDVAIRAKDLPECEDDDKLALSAYVDEYVNYYKGKNGVDPTYSYKVTTNIEGEQPKVENFTVSIDTPVSASFDDAIVGKESDYGFYLKSDSIESAKVYADNDTELVLNIGKKTKLDTPLFDKVEKIDGNTYITWEKIENVGEYKIEFYTGSQWVERIVNKDTLTRKCDIVFDPTCIKVTALSESWIEDKYNPFIDSDPCTHTTENIKYVGERTYNLLPDTTLAGNENTYNSSINLPVVIDYGTKQVDISEFVNWRERTNGATVTGIINDINNNKTNVIVGKKAGTATLRAPDKGWFEGPCGTVTINVSGYAMSSKADFDKLATAGKDGNYALWSFGSKFVMTNDIDYASDTYHEQYLMPIAANKFMADAYVGANRTWGIFGDLNPSDKWFSGIIDGNGFSIKNAIIPYGTALSEANGLAIGNCFITKMAYGAELKNIAFENLHFETPYEAAGTDMYLAATNENLTADIDLSSYGQWQLANYTACTGIIGWMQNCKVQNVFVETEMTFSTLWGDCQNGILVGSVAADYLPGSAAQYPASVIENCVVKTAYAPEYNVNINQSGALIGQNLLTDSNNFRNCFVISDLTLANTDNVAYNVGENNIYSCKSTSATNYTNCVVYNDVQSFVDAQLSLINDLGFVWDLAIGEQTVNYGGLAVNGNSAYKIVVSDTATSEDNASAILIKDYLNRATSCSIQLFTDKQVKNSENIISIGRTDQFSSNVLVQAELYQNGYYITVIGNSIYIYANTAEGLYYGAQAYLAKQIGYEVYAHDEIAFNTYDVLPLASFDDYVEVPDFEYRAVTYGEVQNDKTAEFYGDDYRLAAYKNYNGIDWITGIHFLGSYVNVDECSGWFKYNNQLCLSASGTADYFAEQIFYYVKNYPTAVHFCLGQADNSHNCICYSCLINNYKNGGAAGSYVIWLNSVAEKVEALMLQNGIDREIFIVGLAYYAYDDAPVKSDGNGGYIAYKESVVCRENVAILYAPIDACFVHALNDTSCSINVNGGYAENLKKWTAICSNVMIQNYYAAYYDYDFIYNDFSSFQENAKLFKELGIYGVKDEMIFTRSSSPFSAFKTYLRSKVYWDVNADIQTLTTNFFNQYYKEASSAMTDFYNAYLDAYGNACFSFSKDDMVDASNWSYETLCSLQQHIDNAYSAIEGKYEGVEAEMMRLRIRETELFISHYFINDYASHFSSNELEELQNAYNQDIAKFIIR